MRIDEDFLDEVGLGDMPGAEKREFIAHAEEELEVRVGKSISQNLSEAQLSEFEQIQDDKIAADWLEKNAPNFRETVREVFETFKDELMNERSAILG